MRSLGRVAWFLAGVSLALLPLRAAAQVPPHVPGTICFTPGFWCWAQPPGPPGYPCGCPTPSGIVGGWLG